MIRPGRSVATILVLFVLAGYALQWVPERKRALPKEAVETSDGTRGIPAASEVHERFQQAVVMLHARRPDMALAALERVLELAPSLPEAHVNAGFALLDLDRPDVAAGHFRTAIDLRPRQANAYYGLALASERQGDTELAVGAMRTFVHLSDDRAHVRRARAAIWEWGTKGPIDGAGG